MVFSSATYARAATPITHDGKEGIFLEKEKASKLLFIVETEYPSCKKENSLLEKELETYKEVISLKDSKLKEEENLLSFYKELRSEYPEDNSSINAYINVGIFVGGVATGMLAVYISSEILNNIR